MCTKPVNLTYNFFKNDIIFKTLSNQHILKQRVFISLLIKL